MRHLNLQQGTDIQKYPAHPEEPLSLPKRRLEGEDRQQHSVLLSRTWFETGLRQAQPFLTMSGVAFQLVAAFLALALATPAYAAADVARGETLYTSRCGACHSIDSNRTGPKHRGVIGRKAGSIADFGYSPALNKTKFVWTPQKLDKWLQGPSKLVRGTVMAFTVPVAADRAAIIAYLATQR